MLVHREHIEEALKTWDPENNISVDMAVLLFFIFWTAWAKQLAYLWIKDAVLIYLYFSTQKSHSVLIFDKKDSFE